MILPRVPKRIRLERRKHLTGFGRPVARDGGWRDEHRSLAQGSPVARVHLLSDGQFRNESHGSLWNSGRTAVLHSENITLVVTSKAVSLYDRSLFLAHGQDPATFETVVVKSPHCQPHMFEQGAELVLNVDAPGSTSANLKSLGHTRCSRPIFPLDENVTFTPKAKTFQRDR